MRAAELIIANKELAFQNEEKGKRAAELVIANKELLFQNEEKVKRVAELIIAYKLNAEKDKFFSIIAHDLRSPFQFFLGLTEEMAKELPSLTKDEMQKIAVAMRDSAANIFRLLENLLQWGIMQQGLMPFSPKVVRLLQIMDESIAMVLDSAQNKEIKIIYGIPDGMEICVDNNMFQTVIRNLISNAVKFTPKGGEITLSAKSTADKSVELSVKDNGIGMSHKMVDDIFRIDVRTNRKGTEGESSADLAYCYAKNLWKSMAVEFGGKVKKAEAQHSILLFLTILIRKYKMIKNLYYRVCPEENDHLHLSYFNILRLNFIK